MMVSACICAGPVGWWKVVPRPPTTFRRAPFSLSLSLVPGRQRPATGPLAVSPMRPVLLEIPYQAVFPRTQQGDTNPAAPPLPPSPPPPPPVDAARKKGDWRVARCNISPFYSPGSTHNSSSEFAKTSASAAHKVRASTSTNTR